MKNINLKRIGWLCSLQIRETHLLEYFAPVITTMVLILLSGLVNDNWHDRMADIVLMTLTLTFLAAVAVPFTQLVASNGPLTKMILPASNMEKYLSGWIVSIYRCIYWLVGAALTLTVFIGLAQLFGSENIPHTAKELTEIVMEQEPLAYLLLPPIIIVFSIAYATPKKIKSITYTLFTIEIFVVFGLGALENTYPDGELPMWMNILIFSILTIVSIVWSYMILKHVQPKKIDYAGHLF